MSDIGITDEDRETIDRLVNGDATVNSLRREREETHYVDGEKPPAPDDQPPIEAEECFKIRVLRDETDWSVKSLAKFFGRARGTVIRHAEHNCSCDYDGFTLTSTSRTVTPTECYRMCILREMDVTLRDIGIHYSVDKRTVGRHVDGECSHETPSPRDIRHVETHRCAAWRICAHEGFEIPDNERYGTVRDHVHGRCDHVTGVEPISRYKHAIKGGILD